MSGSRENTREGQPISVDETIDEVARKALAEARRREELQRLRERENPGAKTPGSNNSR